MGGERERAELAAFEALLSKCIADALVAQLRKEADAHGVDVLTWLTRDKGTDRIATLARSNRPCPVWQLQNGSRRRLRHANGGLYWEAPADRAMTS